MAELNEADAQATVTNYWHWYGIPTFLRCPFQPDLKDTDIGLVGVPYSGGNSIERMQYLGPRAVRNRSTSYRRAHREFGINPFELARVRGRSPLDACENVGPMRRWILPVVLMVVHSGFLVGAETLQQLVNQRQVACNLTGDGSTTNKARLSLFSTSAKPLTVEIPGGQVFLPQDAEKTSI